MNNDLCRSVRLLEEALAPSPGSLLRTPIGKKSKLRSVTQADPDLSITVLPHEVDMILNDTPSFIYNQTMKDLLDTDKTIPGGIIQKQDPWKTASDSLYLEFFEILQGQTGSQDALEVLAELARCCSDTLSVVRGLKSKVATKVVEEEKWLEKEKDTWRLLFILFQDRLMIQNLSEEGTEALHYHGRSEKLCIENLFKRDHLIRECQLVIDWLEADAGEKENQILHFSDVTVGWENTLHQLQSNGTIAFGSSRQIVDKIDPDAPHYQEKCLHDLDREDEKRLSKSIFKEIRSGKLEEAQKLARQCGHSWKAALFEGWQLYHNPNIKEDMIAENMSEADDGYEEMECHEVKNVEGNSNRDIWKIMAIKYAMQNYIDIFEKAAIGVFCGHLNAVLPVCSTWEDYLWAYMKIMVDIRVESEIRDYCSRYNSYVSLPDEYWQQGRSLNEIFGDLESSTSKLVREESKDPYHIIQKYVILDEIPALLGDLLEWSESPSTSTHFLRFSAHLVLFLDQIGRGSKRDCVAGVIRAYIKRLMKMNETQLVAHYVSKLNLNSQVHLYAQHLENITDLDERKQALHYAEQCGLDLFKITKQIVENIRHKSEDLDQAGNLQKKLTETDKLKISALDWLSFFESQRVELLIQSNALIFNFLVMGKLDAAQLAFNKVPIDAVGELTAEIGDDNKEFNKNVKEHLSYKAYLEAYESFNAWFKQSKNKPAEPAGLPPTATFPEKVIHEHRISQYKADVDRWELTTTHLANTAKTLLYNVLLFPDGWLIGARDADHLRKTVLPEVSFLLYSVLCDTKMYGKCVELGNIIASEQYLLYKEFSKDQLGDLLKKIGDASLALTELHRDPWGNEIRV
ncbi:nuclear pore complex protein Nup107 [Euwallacea fornicatus]|uniref:nuclear pore complex protein Nup107 n=1 Tax=Euwallacea fornicatus TaxID=995702 RepID=UPI00338EDAF4